ncbi:MarR family winged helix-turn-helix transcriptional regulator [Micromonospora sp. NPDC005806]|uniref:MarR family winged helix-turn-helix transcriptional regulator n=1 Tax=Micromonospora sp. NPDC005806 TaxID=3364234 RepID=UPI003689DF73
MTRSTDAPTTFGPQLIGRTEKALNALLDRQLAGTGITEPQWVTLTLTVTSGGTLTGDALLARISDALKVDEADARRRVAELAAAGLVRTTGNTIAATERGEAQWREVRETINQITPKLWGDLPEAELTIAGRVLNAVLARANALLSAA